MAEIAYRQPKLEPIGEFRVFQQEDIEQAVVSRFEEQVERYAQKDAIVSTNHRWTYSELNRQANRVARALVSMSLRERSRIALLFEHDAPMVAAMFGTLKAHKSYVPLDLLFPKERLVYMLRDSQADVVVTNNRNLELARSILIPGVRILNFDEIDKAVPADNLDLRIPPSALAYILYTSGSTGEPKGVMQTHRNILHHIRVWTNALQISPSDRMTLLSSFSWDSAVQDMYGALLNGATTYPLDVKEEGFERLVDCVLDNGMTIYHATVPLHRYFVRALRERHQVPKLRVLAMGADMIYKRDVDQFQELFADGAIMVNAYGSTETTTALIYTIDTKSKGLRYPLPVGHAVEATEVELLDENGELSGSTDIGEIAIKSAHVALGYLNKPQETKAKFKVDVANSDKRVYLTGDLGRRLPDGSIALLGRKDFQVKIRGFRVELGEIEATLAECPVVQDAVVKAYDHGVEGKRLAAYVVPVKGQSANSGKLRKFLRGKLPDYMIPAIFIALDALPLTPNKKIDRHALPEPDWAGRTRESRFVAPRTLEEHKLARIWAEVLGLEKVGIEDNFFELGGDSLMAVQVVSEAVGTGLRLSPRQIFKHQTITELASVAGAHQTLSAARDKGVPVPGRTSIQTQLSDDAYPASHVQRGVYFQCLMAPKSSGIYVEQFSCSFFQALDAKAFGLAWQELADRHHALRTAFVRGRPTGILQRVDEHIAVTVDQLDWRDISEVEQQAKLAVYAQEQVDRGFKLSEAPLFRLALIRLADERYRFVWTYHHIILDGWSEAVILEELVALYGSLSQGSVAELPRRRPFGDYIRWLEDRDVSAAEVFWRNGIDSLTRSDRGFLSLDVHNSFGRAPVISEFRVPSKNLMTAAQTERVTLNTLLQGLWALALSACTGKQDVVYGTIVSGREIDLPGIESMVGLFAGSLPVRATIEPDRSLSSWLRSLQDHLADVRHNEGISLGQIEKWGGVSGDSPPLFESMFVFLNFPSKLRSQQDAASLLVSDIEYRTAPHFPITIVADPNSELLIRVLYRCGANESDAVRRLLATYEHLLELVAADPNRKLSDLLGLGSA